MQALKYSPHRSSKRAREMEREKSIPSISESTSTVAEVALDNVANV
jgi:hypothetical protein